MASLRGQVIAITGAASGIGLATATLLAERGAVLSLADSHQQRLDSALQSLTGNGHISTVVDVCNSSQVDGWISKTVQELGTLNGAVNLAGVVGPMKPLRDLTDDDWDFVIGVNGRGVFNCLRAQLGSIAEGGSIVNAASVAGQMGMPAMSLYSASKYAVIGLTKSAAKENGNRNVRVNCIAPGTIATPMVADMILRTGQEIDTSARPLARAADPREVATVIEFLLGEGASFVTGTVYNVDGGHMA